MSRRSGRAGRPRHADHRGGPRPHDPARVARPGAPGVPSPDAGGGAAPEALRDPGREAPIEGILRGEPPVAVDLRPFPLDRRDDSMVAAQPIAAELPRSAPIPETPRPSDAQRAPDQGADRPADRSTACTTAQLRRFIKSRAYIPMHEIRRRFAIAAEDDDVIGIVLGSGRIFVGLPPREATMLGELFRAGEVGYELQLDPIAPVVVGVYPMRPVTRA